MSSAGILLAPRSDEAYGLSVVEAMAAGLPVVAAAAGGHLETMGRVAGAALFSPGDIDRAAALLRSLAQDIDARDTYGQALQARQQRDLTLTAQARATERVYETVL
jgi:glycosyltransferase involved in cell wall biosynthesis